jgi:hypothetical protein
MEHALWFGCRLACLALALLTMGHPLCANEEVFALLFVVCPGLNHNHLNYNLVKPIS